MSYVRRVHTCSCSHLVPPAANPPGLKPLHPQVSLDGGMFMMVYILGVAKSWMYWPLIAGVVFLFKFKKKKRRFEEQHPGQVAMAWPIVEQVRNTAVCVDILVFVKPSAYEFVRESSVGIKESGQCRCFIKSLWSTCRCHMVSAFRDFRSRFQHDLSSPICASYFPSVQFATF